jgi:hypothetical protein
MAMFAMPVLLLLLLVLEMVFHFVPGERTTESTQDTVTSHSATDAADRCTADST